MSKLKGIVPADKAGTKLRAKSYVISTQLSPAFADPSGRPRRGAVLASGRAVGRPAGLTSAASPRSARGSRR